MDEETMCTRSEVQEISDRLRSHVDDKFLTLQAQIQTEEKRMREIAVSEIRTAKESFFKYIGWGGVVGAVGIFYFFGGLQSDFNGAKDDISTITGQLEKVEAFMASGDRFTTSDGTNLYNALREYSDNKDELIIQRVESGFDSISKQLEEKE